MGEAKEIVLKPIPADEANELVKRVHYSGKVVQNSQIHIGVYYHGKLEGAMQFGPSLDKRKIQGLVSGSQWHEFIELNRMAFSDVLPRNSESRALGIAMKLLRKHAPQLKWVVSFADGTQCGDGTIYRAAGFVLTGITENQNLAISPDGVVTHKMTYESNPIGTGYTKVTGGKNDWSLFCRKMGWQQLPGYQLRYIYFIDPSYRARLAVSELPYSEIERRGAGMYKGHKRGAGETDSAAGTNPQTGGASPTAPLLDL
jgi:hypothetical protein